MRRKNGGTRRISTFLCLAAALLAGVLGLSYRRHSAGSHASGRAGTPSEQAESKSNSGAHPSGQMSVRNG